MNVLYLTSDLLFSSRVAAVARQNGISLVVVGSREKLGELLAASPAAALIIDLEHKEAEPAAINTLLTGITPRPQTIAYGPHVKEQLLANAQENGLDMVLSRGQFDQKIGQILQSLSRTP